MINTVMNLSTALIFLALGGLFALLITRKIWLRRVIVLLVFVSPLIIPVIDSNLWLWINGATGELSIISILLLSGFIIRTLTGRELLLPAVRIQLYIFVLLTGLLLYPATLGLVQFDPYVLGYSFELSLIVLSIAVLYWLARQQQMAVILLLIVAAHEAGIYLSVNLWDYLIDPLIWLFSPVLLLVMLLRNRQALVSKAHE